jgi:hypothetical protein
MSISGLAIFEVGISPGLEILKKAKALVVASLFSICS